MPQPSDPCGAHLVAARGTVAPSPSPRPTSLGANVLLDFGGAQCRSLRADAPERVIYVGTLSKLFAPGIRVGWVAAAGSVRDKLVLLKEAADLCQSNLTQFIAQRWLATQPWLRQVEQFRDLYRERCEALLAGLADELPPGCSWSEPTGGFFVWLRLPEPLDSGQLLAKALGARVAYVPGRAFYADGDGAHELRLSFCFPPASQIREGTRRLGEVVHAELELAAALYGDQR